MLEPHLGRRPARHARLGFTLVELMIVVGLLSVLSAIAVPNFLDMRFRSQRSEMPTNVAAIQLAERAYFQEFDTYTSVGLQPRADGALDSQSADWQVTFVDWNALGFQPTQKVRGNYVVTSTQTSFTVTGRCDLDDDDVLATFVGETDTEPRMVSPNSEF